MTATETISSHQARIDELGRIILAYSEVTERLQESQERLEKTVCALRNELSEKNRQLERRNRLAALGEMAAGMAHEIRNPLGGIQLYASMLAQDLVDRPDSLAVVGKIAAGVRRLEGLVSQTLQFTREIQANMAPLELAELISQTVELARPHYTRHGLELRVEGPSELHVRGDVNLLGQAVLNLLLNAAEAMTPPARTVLKYGPREEGFSIAVMDQGPGIDPKIMDRIFNPFFTTRDHGTGLGLAIVHRIIEAHEGTIIASNRPEGGAMFEIIMGDPTVADRQGRSTGRGPRTTDQGVSNASHTHR